MRRSFILVLLAIVLAAGALAAIRARTTSISLRVQGRTRKYILHAPHPLTGPAPLVLVFHGGTDTAENTERITAFDELADREHFVVAYPEGVDKSWADGRGATRAELAGIDDVAFVRAVLADIRRKRRIDSHRIYATGVSNGGIFANRLGCEMADELAAIGPVIGPPATKIAGQCRPSSPISVIGMQGVGDPLMPFTGGDEGGAHQRGSGGSVEGSRAAQSLWARLDGCNTEARSETLPAQVADGTTVTRRTYSGCRAGVSVVWYEIEGGGHRWPGRQFRPAAERLAQKLLGKSTQNLDATEVLWAFFREHSR